jgi:hypothetical protein
MNRNFLFRQQYPGARRRSLSLRKDERLEPRQPENKKEEISMSDAQIGLVVATPVIIGFSIALYRVGVLQRYSAMAAVTASCLIAAVLFFEQ